MRTKIVDDVTFEYPDELSFCFNNVVMNVRGGSYDKMLVTIKDIKSDTSFVDTRAMFNNACFFDFSQYIQSFFDTSNIYDNLGRKFKITVDMYSRNSLKNSIEFETFAIWGAMTIGETYNGSRNLTWFKNYPFTVSMYSASDNNVQVIADGVIQDNIPVTQKVNMLSIEQGYDAEKIAFNLPFKDKESVFDHTFDYTFTGSKEDTTIICTADDSNEGVYLRWINRHGMYCYWLFLTGDEKKQISNDGEFLRNNMHDHNFINGFNGGSGRYVSKVEETSINLCAPLVDSDTYDFLFSLAASPIVDMYCGKDESGNDCWKAVNISVGNYNKVKKMLQDFEAVLILPQTNIQNL